MSRAAIACVAAALLAAAALAAPAWAQIPGFDLGQPGGGGSGPVEITATNGIEWDRAGQRYIASGDAKAVRGDTSVQADRLIAYYRERQGTGTQIYRYEAVGNVRIATPTQNAVADQAVYDVDSGVMVLTGRALRLTTPDEVLTARDSLEYWTERHLAVARGDATVITRDDRRMRGDVLAVYMLAPGEQLPPRPAPRVARNQRPGAAAPSPMPVPSESNRVKRVEAFGNVLVSAQTAIARGDRGVYSAETGIATITGNVRLTRDEQQVAGGSVEVDMNTGVTRVERDRDGRVRALLMPGQNQGQTPGQTPSQTQGQTQGQTPGQPQGQAPAQTGGERRR